MNLEKNQPANTLAPAETPDAGAVVPVWMIILLFLLLYWGAIYFEEHGGWFHEQVYAPYASIQEVDQMWPKGGDEEIIEKGRRVYAVCAACHMDSGVGNPGNGCPPLMGSEWVAAEGPNRLIRIVSKGLTGPVKVKGQVYGTGQMMPVGDQMQGDEKQKAEDIAALLSYVRKTFGNGASMVTPKQVEAIRSQIKDRNVPFTPDELEKVPVKE